MLKTNVHLHFNGNCLEALRFYEKCLGGKIIFSMTWKDSPAAQQVPVRWAKKIIHATFKFGGQTLTADDAPPGSYSKPQGFQVTVSSKNPAQAKKVFKALTRSAKVLMPFAKTFWSPGFGMLVDRFGIPWMVNTEQRKS